jgi:hypothetical protein
MRGTEKIFDYSGESYYSPILGNRFSYAEAGEFMGKIDGRDLETQWRELWSNWAT